MSDKIMDNQHQINFPVPERHYSTVLHRRNPHAQSEDAIIFLSSILNRYEENLRASGTLPALSSGVTDQLFKMTDAMPVSDRLLISMALVNFGNPSSTALFINSLHHENSIVRYISAESLAKICDPRSIDQLFTLYNDESVSVRLAADKALIKML
ncbi:HEAT repeat domain-containing protein [Methanoplanus endosymbiosus]|uniref:HEAT repeat domain-containing protein n=1 Tax=Methanoplanus endosymbiosus TaxID=33865 RepID=A0A9E7TKP9_9EURY|nr:HEAT repeat domain-containing protein [Methanoplanus endosymbiosus]UUX91441.1 HEAT repeat domain-containing protein [Methanoplanus endosymbiosus]